MLAYATGAMGMGLDDFMRMTPEEFGAAGKAWADGEERRQRSGWERARAAACLAVAPHMPRGRGADPRKLMPMPWDKPAHEAEKTTREEAERRFRELTEKRNHGQPKHDIDQDQAPR